MSLSTCKMTDLSFTFLPARIYRYHSHHHYHQPPFKVFFSTSNNPQTPKTNPNSKSKTRRYPWDSEHSPRSPSSSAPWIQQWTPHTPSAAHKVEVLEKPATAKAQNPIDRIVHRLRNLGNPKGLDLDGSESDGETRLGDLLERKWKRPDFDGLLDVEESLPWEREEEGKDANMEPDRESLKKRRVNVPTLAELTMEDSELRRLRRMGIGVRERLTVPQAGVTQAMVEKIREVWRKSELVRLKFHETLAHDMKIAHELVERRTGGLVIWRAGSVMVVYRGSSYQNSMRSLPAGDNDKASADVSCEGNKLFIPEISEDASTANSNSSTKLLSLESNPSTSTFKPGVEMTIEEAEFNDVLDGLGPRFVDWWGTRIIPVDADLLPQNIPGFKAPFRLLPTGMRSRLTSAEMTNLRKMARPLPCHFALGRNRNHHGLAAAILKLWEKSLVVKIAIKRGVQNTNNKLMAEELKKLTGGILLQRNKYYIVIYRGKDFLTSTVAAALAERQELTKGIHDVEEKIRLSVNEVLSSKVSSELPVQGKEISEEIQEFEETARGRVNELMKADNDSEHPAAGTLAEFLEAQARWGRQITDEERQEMKKEASKSIVARLVKKIEHKLSVAEAKKLRAERLLAKIESSMIPVGPPDDKEIITEEERAVFRRIGLRMKAYLPLGIRGVFDGVIENMHLHWKYRELVKLISKQKTLSFLEDTAKLLECESGGILVSIEKLPKAYALIYYRGKNYQRPISIRPRNLLTKAKALKRSVAMQRHEALAQHICDLEKTIEKYRSELGNPIDLDIHQKKDPDCSNHSESQEDSDSDIDDESDDYDNASLSSDDCNSFENECSD